MGWWTVDYWKEGVMVMFGGIRLYVLERVLVFRQRDGLRII